MTKHEIFVNPGEAIGNATFNVVSLHCEKYDWTPFFIQLMEFVKKSI